MKAEIEWHDTLEKPVEGKTLLILSKYSYLSNRYAKNIGIYADIDNTGPKFYVHGNPDTDVVYWAYFPEMPPFIK